jgi:DNA-directed RNA polymerase specialized sigma subunit
LNCVLKKETTQPKLEEASGQVAVAIAEVVKALRALPNAQNLSLDETMNLESLAEAELRNCAKTIEEAAKTLLQAKPKRSKPKQIGVIDEEDITEAILDAARAITTATGHLIGEDCLSLSLSLSLYLRCLKHLIFVF